VSGKLHRFLPDGMTEVGQVVVDATGSLLLSACASDGTTLWVAAHDITGMPTVFYAYDQTLAPAGTVMMPQSLQMQGYDRCVDFAWTPFGYYGLFGVSGGDPRDSNVHPPQITPFAFDGSVGPGIDAGLLHGIGEFVP
jgi:hypothetical protein